MKVYKRSGIVRLKRDGTRAETRFRLSPKRTSPFKSAGASVQSTAGSWGVRISFSNAGYTTFRGSVKSTGYPLHSQVSSHSPPPPPVRHCVPSGFKRTLLLYSFLISEPDGCRRFHAPDSFTSSKTKQNKKSVPVKREIGWVPKAGLEVLEGGSLAPAVIRAPNRPFRSPVITLPMLSRTTIHTH
jgi:hypothetical protein